MAKVSWEAPFLQALQRGETGAMLQVLQRQSTDHASTPNAAVKSYALKLIRGTFKHDPEQAYRLGLAFAGSGDETGEELGAILLADHYTLNPEEVNGILHRLADSPNWEVREWVASACGNVLTAHFETFYPVMHAWVHDPSGNVRRAAALAAMFAGKSRREGFAERLLDLLEPLMADTDPYVKKNLGAFAIGDGLLRYYPEPTVRRLHRWAHSEDEMVRWNLAMVFKAAESAKHADNAVEVLQVLLRDERAQVKKAVQAALKNNLNKRKPELVERLLAAGGGMESR